MDKNDSFDGPLQEGRHTTLRSFSWGNREFTISSDKISLYVGGHTLCHEADAGYSPRIRSRSRETLSRQVDLFAPGAAYTPAGL